MIREYNSRSLRFGIPGIALQFAGFAMIGIFPDLAALWAMLMALGSILLLTGLAYYAKVKGQNPAWCVLAFLSWLGILVLALLPDRHTDPRAGLLDPADADCESLPPEPQPIDDTSSPSTCLSCDQAMPPGTDSCPKCGWSYRSSIQST